MQKQLRTVGDQRLDKHHVDTMLSLIDAVFLAQNKYLLTAPAGGGTEGQGFVLFGWVIESNGGLSARVNRSIDSALILGARAGFENLQWMLATDSILSVSLPDNTVSNYVEVVFADLLTQPETVAIWDPTANGGTGAEFTQTSDVVDQQAPTLVSNVMAFTGLPDHVPLAVVTTSGGVITNVTDARPLLFSLGATFSFGGTRSDRGIGSLKNAFDAITSILKEMKGTTHWYDSTASGISGLGLLERLNYLLVDGGNFSFNGGPGVVWWDATTGIGAPNQAFTYTISAGSVTLTAGQVAYVTLPDVGTAPGGALTPVVVAGGSYPLDSTHQRNLILAYLSTVSGAVYVGGQLELKGGETGQIGIGASTQLLTAIGVPDEATSAPPYTSTFNIHPGDSLTHAVSELDSALDVLQVAFSGPVYDAYTLIGAGGQVANTVMTLPNSESYQVGNNQLEVYFNGVKQQAGSGNDYLEINGGGGVGTQIQVLIALAANTKVEFRVQFGGTAYQAALTPNWKKYTTLYSALSTGSPTNNVLLVAVPAKTVVHAVIIKHSIQFAGGTLSGYTVSVGTAAGGATLYSGGTDNVFVAVTDAAYLKYLVSPQDVPAFSGPTNINLYATSSGGNLNQATAGSVDVWLLTSLLP